jgi:hypothetical protein
MGLGSPEQAADNQVMHLEVPVPQALSSLPWNKVNVSV